MKGLLDTSVLIAGERGERIAGALPDEAAVSVVTIAELHLGVLLADDPAIRETRLRTLTDVEHAFDALPVDRAVARRFAGFAAEARRAGRRPKIIDSLIAATAVVHEMPVYTQDSDFDEMPGVEVIRV